MGDKRERSLIGLGASQDGFVEDGDLPPIGAGVFADISNGATQAGLVLSVHAKLRL